MKRIAIVVQRYHETIVGGSEALAWQYAMLLRESFQVDILTTTALDYLTWSNELSEGDETIEGIQVRRFPVSITRSDYWHHLNYQFLKTFQKTQNLTSSFPLISWSFALQEELIRHQGPYSHKLCLYLKNFWQDYALIFFTTYLYPTTYFGISQVPASRSILIPTLHNEPHAYLPAYRYRYQSVAACLWLTHAEKRLGEKLWGEFSGSVTAMYVNTESYEPYEADYSYLLYCGRIEPSKGCEELIRFFLQYKQEHPCNLSLILTGSNSMEIPDCQDIDFRGFVSAEEKFALMAGASLLMMPSPYESFSIVTLEAMAQKTPVLVNGRCQVLVDHINKSGSGGIYNNYEEFSAVLRELIANPQKRLVLGQQGRDYVVQNFSEQGVRDRLLKEIRHCLNSQQNIGV